MEEDDNLDVEEGIFAGIHVPDDGSGSEYQTSEAEHVLSQDENKRRKPASNSRASSLGKSNPLSNKGLKVSSTDGGPGLKRGTREERPTTERDVDSDGHTSLTNERTQKDPRGPRALKLQSREIVTNLLKRRESPVKPEEVESKKRWKRSLNPDYRDLLNSDIANAVARNIPEDNIPLQGSQIGSTIWTADEKDNFFIALSRLGRDNVRLIATRIGTKSELEVQEYIQLLHTSFSKRRSDKEILELPDVPAAVEISEECCKQLEETADAFAFRQEKGEIEIEKEKWGDSWLLTPEISHWLNKRRNQDGGMEAVDEVLPAANLFNLDKWLELSDRVFMNSDELEYNWHNLARDGQVPSIRATAFEDLHSLAVFVTKKLISTTLYCTMSRERATQAHKTKHAEVTPADVEAAVNILKMAHNCDEYWRKCPRRCKLQMVDDDDDDDAGGDNNSHNPLTYEEVETALSSLPHRRRSRSRSISHLNIPPNKFEPTQSDESESELKSADESALDYATQTDSENESVSISDTGLGASKDSKVALAREEKFRTMESYTESLDLEESRQEELRLWKILRKPRGDHKEEFDVARPKRLANEFDEQSDWREKVGFRSEWEVVDGGMVDEQAFQRNRSFKRRKRGRKRSETRADRNDGREAQEGFSSEHVGHIPTLESENGEGEERDEEHGLEDEGTDREDSESDYEEVVEDEAMRKRN